MAREQAMTADLWARLLNDAHATCTRYAAHHARPWDRGLTPAQVGALSNRRHGAWRRLEAAIERSGGLAPGSIRAARFDANIASLEAS